MSAATQIRPLHTDQDRAELLDLVKTRSFRRGKFTLSSGVESELYFNLKPTMMSPRSAYLAATAFLDALHGENAAFIGGLEMGAVPIIGAVAAVGEMQGRPVGAFFVRKKVKEHGTRDLVEGLGPEDSLQGKRVVIADDVATSGGSIFRAVEAARGAGATVDAALVLVDRQEGAAAFLAKHGVRLVSIFRASEFLS